MSNLAEKKTRPLRCGAAVIVFAIFALLGTVLGCSPTFLRFGYYRVKFIPLYRWDTQDYLYLAFEILPILLFMLYAFAFYKRDCAKGVMGLAYGLLSIYPLYNIYRLVESNGITAEHLLTMVFGFALHITFTLATISVLRGSSKRVSLVFSVVLGFIMQFISLIAVLVELEYYTRYMPELWVTSRVAYIFGKLFFYIALLIFGMANRNREEQAVPPVVIQPMAYPQAASAVATRLSAEEALKMLAEKRNGGAITEEEYQALCAEIIRSL